MRPFVVAANWKMNKTPAEAEKFFQEFAKLDFKNKNQIVFFVPAVNLLITKNSLLSTKVLWGAQNCHYEMKGAFTGENSPQVMAEIGAKVVLVGHSERRTLFGETNEVTALKVKALQAVQITPMLCVGESLAEREAGVTAKVISQQLEVGLSHCSFKQPLMIAYEPVWAIGTGKVASPAQANEAHLILRKTLKEISGNDFAMATPILYGGSVKPENANEISSQVEVDGFLVGGASLEVASFAELCKVQKN